MLAAVWQDAGGTRCTRWRGLFSLGTDGRQERDGAAIWLYLSAPGSSLSADPNPPDLRAMLSRRRFTRLLAFTCVLFFLKGSNRKTQERKRDFYNAGDDYSSSRGQKISLKYINVPLSCWLPIIHRCVVTCCMFYYRNTFTLRGRSPLFSPLFIFFIKRMLFVDNSPVM